MKLKKVTALVFMSLMLFPYNAFGASIGKVTGNALEMSAKVTAVSLKIDVDLPIIECTKNTTLKLDIYGGGGKGQIICKPLAFQNCGSVNVKVKFSGYNINDVKEDGKSSGIILSKTAFDPSKETTAAKKIFVALKATEEGTATDLDIGDPDKIEAFTYTDVTGGIFGTLATAKYKADDAATVTAVKDCIIGEMEAAVDAEDAPIADAKAVIVVKLDGAINPNGFWEDGDALNVTPIFELEPVLATNAPVNP